MATKAGFPAIIKELITMLPDGTTIRGYLESASMSFADIRSSRLKMEIENFASTTLEIRKSYKDEFNSNMSSGIKLVRGAFVILSSLKGASLFAMGAYCILSIGMAVFNLKEENNIECVVRGILEEKLDQDMVNECEGAKLVFVNSTKFLCGIGIRKLAPHETSSLSAHVSIEAGVNLLGKLSSIIKDLQIKTCQNYLDRRKKSQFDRLMKYVHMYCCLAILRKGVLLHLYALLHLSDNSPGIANGVKAVLDEQNAQDMSVLEFLTKPNKENVILSFLFDPIQHEIVEKFLGLREMKVKELQHLTDGQFAIRPLAHPKKRLFMANTVKSWIRIDERPETSQTIFKFHAKNDYTFIISSLRWPDYFIRMEMGGLWVAGKKGSPDDQAGFRIVQIEEECKGEILYLLAPNAMKTKLLYAASLGRVCGESCKPNENHFWMIQKGVSNVITEMISLLPGDESIRERFKKASMDLDDLTCSELKKEVENFASSALDIKEINPFSFKENMLIGIKLMRSALNICSLVNDTHLVASSAYLILSIGVTAFNINVESNIDFVVQEILDKQQDDDLTNACKNAQVDFGNASNFLCGIGFRKMVDHDISSLESHVPIDAGVDLLGNLVLIIQDRQNKTCQSFIDRSKCSQFDRLMKYVNMYCCLVTIRKGVLLHLYALLHISDSIPQLENRVKAVLDEQHAQDKSLLEFFIKPNKENVILSFLMDPNQHEIVEKFLDLREVKVNELKHLTEGEFIIRPLAYPTKRLYMADVFGKWIRISENAETSQTKFTFHSKDYNTFTISSIKWPEYFIRMEMGGVWVAGKKGCPDGQADFKIVPIDEVNQGEPCYLLAPTVMKTKLLYAASKGRVCGESCIPNTNHFWMIEKY